jgi:hypothetical protein
VTSVTRLEQPKDSPVSAAAHALAAGDPLGALKRIALRDDAPALALRGIAMAQLGDFVRARAQHAPSVQERLYPGLDVWSPKPRLRSPRVTSPGPPRRSTPRGRRSKRPATGLMRRMRGISRCGVCY